MRPRVLLVDDDQTYVHDLRHHLGEQFAWVAVNVSDGATLIAAIRRCKPDAVLLDLELTPGKLTGFELLDRIRREEPRLPVVIVSRHDRSRMAAPAMRRGAIGYLEKGEPLEQLAAILEQGMATATIRARSDSTGMGRPT